MLGQMNLLLHGLEHPDIRYGNTLAVKLSEIGDNERVDVVLTIFRLAGRKSTPFVKTFPPTCRPPKRLCYFYKLIMRNSAPSDVGSNQGGRAAVVVPDGILSQEGVAARVRQKLVDDLNLKFVIRSPRGVFEPYTKSSTSVLFFDRDGPRHQPGFTRFLCGTM